jgi:hypothetical protein
VESTGRRISDEGGKLKMEQTIDPGLLKVLMPPFSLQPLVENAVQQGLHVDESPKKPMKPIFQCVLRAFHTSSHGHFRAHSTVTKG